MLKSRSVVKETLFDIKKKPGPMVLVVETTSMSVFANGKKWKAKKKVKYQDSIVNLTIHVRGQRGMVYEMTMKLNGVTKSIKEELPKNGKNLITKHKWPSEEFNLFPTNNEELLSNSSTISS